MRDFKIKTSRRGAVPLLIPVIGLVVVTVGIILGSQLNKKTVKVAPRASLPDCGLVTTINRCWPDVNCQPGERCKNFGAIGYRCSTDSTCPVPSNTPTKTPTPTPTITPTPMGDVACTGAGGNCYYACTNSTGPIKLGKCSYTPQDLDCCTFSSPSSSPTPTPRSCGIICSGNDDNTFPNNVICGDTGTEPYINLAGDNGKCTGAQGVRTCCRRSSGISPTQTPSGCNATTVNNCGSAGGCAGGYKCASTPSASGGTFYGCLPDNSCGERNPGCSEFCVLSNNEVDYQDGYNCASNGYYSERKGLCVVNGQETRVCCRRPTATLTPTPNPLNYPTCSTFCASGTIISTSRNCVTDHPGSTNIGICTVIQGSSDLANLRSCCVTSTVPTSTPVPPTATRTPTPTPVPTGGTCGAGAVWNNCGWCTSEAYCDTSGIPNKRKETGYGFCSNPANVGDGSGNNIRCCGCGGGTGGAPTPAGAFDVANCSGFFGWACSTFAEDPLTIKFYEGETNLGEAVADQAREEEAIRSACIGIVDNPSSITKNHGFNFTNIPNDIKDGQTHTITAKIYGYNGTYNGNLLGTKSFTCALPTSTPVPPGGCATACTTCSKISPAPTLASGERMPMCSTCCNGFTSINTTRGRCNTASGVCIPTVTPTPVYGDYNGDGFVNRADYNVWKSGFGTAGKQLLDFEKMRRNASSW